MKAAFEACRRHFVYAMLFSAALNILFIAPMLYMLQVYDRVIPTMGGVTLLFLTIVLLFALVTMAIFDALRARLLVRAPLELLEWWKASQALQGTRMLVMTGTGMLSDFGIDPLDLHYEILKWSIVAKLRGAKLLFVSVGAGPIADPLSRWIVKRAVSLADYRSYRDDFSKEYLAGIGFDNTVVRVVADPAVKRNTHEVHARGAFGEFRLEVQNAPSPANPKSGVVTAMSILKALRNRQETLVVGL